MNSHFAICIEAPIHPALMHATIFGNVVSIVGRMYGRRAEYDKKVRSQRIYSSSSVNITKVLDLEYFARLHKLPKDVRQRSSYYFYETDIPTFLPGWSTICRQSGSSTVVWITRYGWEVEGGDNLLLDVAQIPEEYPVDLQGEIFYHLYRELFDLPLFDCLSFSCRSIFC